MSLSFHDQRIFFSDDGTIIDYSKDLKDFRAGTKVMAYVAGEDYLYLGSFLPFNHKWFEMSVVSDQTAAVSVDIWWARQWVAAKDIIDETAATSGKSLSGSGYIHWTTDRLKGWDREQDSSDVTGLSTAPLVYNMFWVRLSWDNDLKATTALKFVGQRFSEDSELYTYYPDLNNSDLKTSFASGKTTWDDQHFAAAEIIARDLRGKGLVISRDQILNDDLFKEASIHKVAEIIYGALGESFSDDVKVSGKLYKEEMDMRYKDFDLDGNARLDPTERSFIMGYMRR